MNKTLCIGFLGLCVCACASHGQGLHIAVMKVNGVACVGMPTVGEHMKAMKERLAQANINLPITGDVSQHIKFFDAPAWFSTDPDWYIVGSGDPLMLSSRAKEIMDAARGGVNTGRWIIYVPEVNLYPDVPALQDMAGFAVRADTFGQGEDAGYIGNCFVSATDGTLYTPTHEVLHIWGLEHNNVAPWNLMYPEPSNNKDPRGTKRLTTEQINAIRAIFN